MSSGLSGSPATLLLSLLASVKRVRDKYETELLELEQSERKLQERCTELKGRLGEVEGEKERLQALVRQKEKELEDMRAVSVPSSFLLHSLLALLPACPLPLLFLRRTHSCLVSAAV